MTSTAILTSVQVHSSYQLKTSHISPVLLAAKESKHKLLGGTHGPSEEVQGDDHIPITGIGGGDAAPVGTDTVKHSAGSATAGLPFHMWALVLVTVSVAVSRVISKFYSLCDRVLSREGRRAVVGGGMQTTMIFGPFFIVLFLFFFICKPPKSKYNCRLSLQPDCYLLQSENPSDQIAACSHRSLELLRAGRDTRTASDHSFIASFKYRLNGRDVKVPDSRLWYEGICQLDPESCIEHHIQSVTRQPDYYW